MNIPDSIEAPVVAVLLSTYNGEQYLSELLDSLLRQDYSNFCIYIRDDGSSDRTVDILNAYSERNPKISVQTGSNLGCVGSFLDLLKSVDADIIMFCDQDDVWLPSKISTAATSLVRNGIDRPILFHTDLIVVDENLATTASSFMRQQGLGLPRAHTLEVLAIQNCVVGCTVAITSALAKIARVGSSDLKTIAMHDWWLALLAKTYGHIIFSPKAEILYRQHGRNVSGAQKKSFWRRVRIQFSRSGLERINTYRVRVADQASFFLELHGSALDERSKKIFKKATYLHPEKGVLSTMAALYEGLRFQNGYMNVALLYTSIATRLLRVLS